ncbi:MAG: N-acetylmannosamine-6-phosphate 2-epimerase [Limnochordia bacterium]|nr:N-acetylmannosamine-6-phosphate 2-epimerase [Limnochordia bacterium]MDI9464139.1 N-acetylmannosamine-6-phosphate 2-epimerase [Bacillota bacterium]NLO96419.1 N-acetylmannosamine-6-phosphate 2-epimerase [Bacillota bacterium]HAN94802.1 N-acetylmannosamine-6-phosphate 2-epimerase [Bacillota bacterium]HOB41170.1 N-acetylmannosamine-6-phosphate 2-epimerase [Limnochordia bacterium]
MSVLHAVHRGLIVSCQALEEEPLHGPMLMAAMARAVQLGGAVGIRANGPQDVEVIKRITGLPVIGIHKMTNGAGEMAITPTFSLAEELVRSGADIIAVDVRRTRPFGEPLAELLPRIRRELGVPVMADCATVEDARAAVEIGVDLVASTFGFRQNGLGTEPDFQLLRDMLQLGVPVVAEGGFWYPEQVVEALELGVWAVVVGSAITRPLEITRRFVRAIEQGGLQ